MNVSAKTRSERIRTLVECAIMVALATILSLIKLYDLPYGGSVTAASMLPILLIAYRHGVPAGLGAGLVYGVIQQLLGLNTLSYATSWQAVLAIIFLDYIIAFTVAGLGGIFRRKDTPATKRSDLGRFACLSASLSLPCDFRRHRMGGNLYSHKSSADLFPVL